MGWPGAITSNVHRLKLDIKLGVSSTICNAWQPKIQKHNAIQRTFCLVTSELLSRQRMLLLDAYLAWSVGNPQKKCKQIRQGITQFHTPEEFELL